MHLLAMCLLFLVIYTVFYCFVVFPAIVFCCVSLFLEIYCVLCVSCNCVLLCVTVSCVLLCFTVLLKRLYVHVISVP